MKLVLTRIDTDDYTYSCSVVIPIEYESPEKFIVDFENEIVKAIYRDVDWRNKVNQLRHEWENSKEVKEYHKLVSEFKKLKKLKKKNSYEKSQESTTLDKIQKLEQKVFFTEPKPEGFTLGYVYLPGYIFQYSTYTNIHAYDLQKKDKKEILERLEFPEIQTLEDWFENNKGKET